MIFHMNHTKFRLNRISYKFAKFLASETCDIQEKNHDNFGKFSKIPLREISQKMRDHEISHCSV